MTTTVEGEEALVEGVVMRCMPERLLIRRFVFIDATICRAVFPDMIDTSIDDEPMRGD